MYNNKTYENIKASILERIPSVDKREGSFTNDMISPISMELEGCYSEFDKLLGVMFLGDSTGEYIEKRAGEYGVKRKLGTLANGTVTFTGLSNTAIPKGSLVATSTGLIFETTSAGNIPEGSTSIIVPIKSQSVGTKYNVMPSTITQIPVSIVGVTSVLNISETTGGTDVESDEELLNRTLFMLRNPSTSGNATHYKMWAMEVSGIGDAKVFPLYSGNGTVMVMPITTSKQKPDQTLINMVQEQIDAKRPIGASVTVTAPTEVILNINAVVVASSEYSGSQIREAYTQLFKQYISESVFKLYTVDYFKCLSLMYDVPGVKQVMDFKLNNGTVNIAIQQTEIQVVGTVTISI